MTIAPTGPVATQATSIHTTTTPATEAKKELDQEVFLSLLVAQLRNQDPTSPMDTTEMMAQSTQLASMEQLTGLADTSRESFSLQMRIAAGSMVGQQVSFVDEQGATHSGSVSSVSFNDAVPMVTVGEHTVALDAVSAITAAAARAAAPAASTSGTSPTTDPTTDPTDTHNPAGTAGTAA